MADVARSETFLTPSDGLEGAGNPNSGNANPMDKAEALGASRVSASVASPSPALTAGAPTAASYADITSVRSPSTLSHPIRDPIDLAPSVAGVEAGPARLHLSDVEATAVQVALFRSLAVKRLRRSDGLPYYNASYDTAIVNACLPVSEQLDLTSRNSYMLPMIAVRTAEIDRQILRALSPPLGPPPCGDGQSSGSGAAAAVRQVVLLGAGLDARAWRLPPAATATAAASTAAAQPQPPAFPSVGGGGEDRGGSASWAEGTEAVAGVGSGNGGGASAQEERVKDREVNYEEGGGDEEEDEEAVVFYELDTGATERLKVEVLGRLPAHRRRVFVRADLAAPEEALAALAAAGHDARQPTVFVAEGLIGYLSREAGNALLAALHSLAAAAATAAATAAGAAALPPLPVAMSHLVLTAPPSPAWRDQLAASGVRLHHLTYEKANETLQRVRAAGWDATLMTAAELGREYGMPDNHIELILGSR